MKQTVLLALGFALALCGSATAQTAPAAAVSPAAPASPAAPPGPAELISNFRTQHGQGRVTLDAALNRIAQKQADAMASKDVLEHDVLGPFNSRVASAGAGRAAENIAYGYGSFEKTLGQWIRSSEHRKNLLMQGASRVGVAHAESARTHRTYWAMEIAGGYERPASRVVKRAPPPPAKQTKLKPRHSQACRLKILGLCL